MITDSEKTDRARRELYKDPGLEVFFTTFLNTFKKIKPTFDLIDGYNYLDLEKALEKNAEEIMRFLDKMVEVKILGKELYDVEIRCQDCNSPNISTNYLCPFCKSLNIDRKFLVEHIPCGYIDTLINFENKNICSRCNKEYKEGGYRISGEWYECPKCSKQLETPLVAHLCRDCGKRFSFEDAICRDIYSYSLSPIAENEMKSGILFPSQVRKLLTSLSYELKNPGYVNGESGSEYKFDFLASKIEKRKKKGRKKRGEQERKDEKIAIDILFSLEPIPEFEVIREYGKILDTKVRTCIVAMPKLDDAANRLATSYSLEVIEAAKPPDAIRKLRKKLAN